MKYILVTGGVISGLGKGIIASSIGAILKSRGIRVTCIKIDPYLNIDAGTFSPCEHGEVFVLDDGGEVDLDLGNYERFMDVTLTRNNNITSGKINELVKTKERRGDYLGTTVQTIPDAIDVIRGWVEKVANTPTEGSEKADVCIIELGGTIGDIENTSFAEALKDLQWDNKRNMCHVHVTPIIAEFGNEQKTKPAQGSCRKVMELGLPPKVLILRTIEPLCESARKKMLRYCRVNPQQVYNVPNVRLIYQVPLLMQSQGIDEFLIKRLNLETVDVTAHHPMAMWKELVDRHDRPLNEVRIVLVGKYTEMLDAYLSVIKALQYASLAINRRLNLKCINASDLEPATLKEDQERYHTAWKEVTESSGMIVPGGFGDRGTEGKILACKWARTNNLPFLGVCLGLQCAVIEFARNVLNWQGANSTEFDAATKHPVVIEMPEHNQGQMGGTMRLGKRKTKFTTETSILRRLYNKQEFVEERHRHRYEVNPDMVSAFEKKGMKFTGRSEDGERMEIMELEGHQYYVAVQFHPEFTSRPTKPSPPFLGLLLAASNMMRPYLDGDFQPTPLMPPSEEAPKNGPVNGTEDHPLMPPSEEAPKNGPVNGTEDHMKDSTPEQSVKSD
ncbi:unnamed protein product [Candidula unifasciata]|uniref:CTP synthase n=1 Tax=Candidula unifasciata TaxID=100452 RepID=A0A8S3YXJ0_9EUPU|nr:unnamed protein product [Candidula unifasciata]